MKPLYAIADDLNALLLQADDGELPPALEEQIDALHLTFEQKVEGCCGAIRNMEAEEAALRAEANRFETRAQAAANGVRRLKQYVKLNLDKLAIQKLEVGLFKVRVQQNSQPTISYTGDTATLPPEFLKCLYFVEKSAIFEAWREGKPLPPGVDIAIGAHLRIT